MGWGDDDDSDDSSHDYVTVKNVMLLHETDKAAHFKFGSQTEWIPLSLINSSLEKHETGEIEIQRWKADDLGLAYVG